MQNILEQLKNVLAKDERLVDESGELLKNKAVELAIKLDKKLIELLLADKQMKEVFFAKAGSTTIFDKDKFIRFVSNKQFLPDSYTAFKNKIGLTEDDEYIREKKDVVLSWPYKDCVLEGGQTKEDAKRNEIFWNQTLAPDEITRLLEPKVFTNSKRIGANGEKQLKEFKADENGNIKDNLIIKGNNLLALHSLKERFSGQVKLIYIDPPYNTGGEQETFTYNNEFDHSTWMTFMKNRVDIVKDLLRNDGFIAVAIDYNELFYLGVLLDEIFGRENRVGVVTVVHKPEGRSQEKFFGTSNEFMLVYARNKDAAQFEKVILSEHKKEKFNLEDEFGKYKLRSFIRGEGLRKDKPNLFYPIYVSPDLKDVTLRQKKGYEKVLPISGDTERTWFLIPESLQKKIEKGEIIAKRNDNGRINIFYKVRETEVFVTHWTDKKYNANTYGTKLLESIIGRKDFNYPKSLYVVVDTLKLMTKKEDIVLDFFAGSGTTGHATLALNKEDGGNRKFILVEQLDEHIDVCVERNQKVLAKEKIDDSFVYTELAKWNENFVKQIKKAKTGKELQKLWRMLKEKARLSYKVDIKEFDKNEDEFTKLSLEDQKRFLIKTLDQNHLYINYSDIDDKEYSVSEEDKKLNKEFY